MACGLLPKDFERINNFETVYDMIISSKSRAELVAANDERKKRLADGRLSGAQAKILKDYVELRNRELTKAWASSSV